MKYLGIDFGLKRIGLATSQGEIASAWKVVEVKSFKDAVEKILIIIKSEEFQKVVVGLPEGKMGKNVLGFIKRLKKEGIDIESSDETLSSKNATSLMVDLNIPKEKRKINDSFSAMIILQNYLDNY